MTIPDKIKIGGETYKIEMVENCNSENRNCDGQILYGKNAIQLRKDLEGDYRDYVFIHELLHGIFEHCGFEQEEGQVDRLARALNMVIKDNQNIFGGEYR